MYEPLTKNIDWETIDLKIQGANIFTATIMSLPIFAVTGKAKVAPYSDSDQESVKVDWFLPNLINEKSSSRGDFDYGSFFTKRDDKFSTVYYDNKSSEALEYEAELVVKSALRHAKHMNDKLTELELVYALDRNL
jgi:hypothetical protein